MISFLVIAMENCIWADNVYATLQPSVLTNCQVIAHPQQKRWRFLTEILQTFKSSGIYWHYILQKKKEKEMTWKMYISVIVNVNWVLIFLFAPSPNNLAFKIASAVLPLVDTKIMQHLIGILLLSPSPYLLDICSFLDKSGYSEAVGKVFQTNLNDLGGGNNPFLRTRI